MSDRLTEMMKKVAQEDPMQIFLGAVAAAEDRTLVTDFGPFNKLMKEYTDKSFLVPERFQPVFQSLEFYQGIYGELESPQIENLFWRLNASPYGIGWIYEFSGGRYRGNRYFLDNEAAAEFLKDKSISPEELDWLWIVAQRAHIKAPNPVRKREILTLPA